MNRKIAWVLDQPVSKRETVLDKLFQLFFWLLRLVVVVLGFLFRRKEE
jgi:hypothetical protein